MEYAIGERELAPVPALAHRTTVTMETIADGIARSFRALVEHAGETGAQWAGTTPKRCRRRSCRRRSTGRSPERPQRAAKAVAGQARGRRPPSPQGWSTSRATASANSAWKARSRTRMRSSTLW